LHEEAEAARHMVEEHLEKEPMADAIFVARPVLSTGHTLRTAWAYITYRPREVRPA
jgi:hypothetical protein